ncbi:MAG: ApaG protein [Verrucomicrobiota bacterium]
MSISEKPIELPGLHVSVDEVRYDPDANTPPDYPHCFEYFISIHNDSDVAVNIRARKWVVTNARGELTVVEGDGVVGKTPMLQPGESFQYNSRHMLDTDWAVAEGSYFGVDSMSRRVMVRIPKFRMELP